MNVFLCQLRCTCLFIVLANIVLMTTSLDHASGNEYPVNFSGEFENFLHGLGSMVYKYKNPARLTADTIYINEYPDITSTEPGKSYWKSDSLLKTQKEVLKDVLMMKLVSYYEDKYKVTHNTDSQDVITTTRSSLPILTNNIQSTAYNQRPRSETYSYDVKTSPRTTKHILNTVNNQQEGHNDVEEVEVL